jgi:hypothetical protein
MRALFLTLCALLLMGCRQERPAPRQPAQQPQEAASNAIGILQKLVNEQNYKSLGFQSLDEVKQAQPGKPMEVYNMGLDRLKSYQAGADPNSLLSPSAETIYPVMVDGNVRSGITIVHKEQGYEPSSFGNADIIQRLSRYRASDAEFAVRIPAFNMYFIGRRVDTRLVLVPIVSDPRLKVQEGETVPIEVVIDQLRPYVNAYNGLPM